MFDARFEVNEQIGLLHGTHHQFEKLHVGLVVALRQVSHFVVIGHEDVHTLRNGAVLDDGFTGF